MLRVKLGSTELPVTSFIPSQSLPAEPSRILQGSMSLAERTGTYLGMLGDLDGPLGQEWIGSFGAPIGYRAGALQAGEGYLQLPAGPTQRVDAVITTTQAVIPSHPYLSYPDQTYTYKSWQFVAVGPTVWKCEGAGLQTFAAGSNPVLDLTGQGCTQISSIVAQKLTPAGSAARIWVAGASATGNHKLYYSDTHGASWIPSAFYGEAIAIDESPVASAGSTAPQGMLVAKSDGSLYRTRGTGYNPTVQMMPPGGGRIHFLGPGKGAIGAGVFFIQAGKVYFTGWEAFSRSTLDSMLAQADELEGLVDGVVTHWAWVLEVCDGWNIWEVMGGGTTWIGLPPQLTGYVEVRKLAMIGPNLLACLVDASGNTAILRFPATGYGSPSGTSRGQDPYWDKRLTDRNPEYVQNGNYIPPQDRGWSILYEFGSTVYDLYTSHLQGGYASITPTLDRACMFVLSYLGTHSYVHTMPPPAHRLVTPGGQFAASATRTLPHFDGGMPDVSGSLIGLVFVCEFPEATGSIRVDYSTNNGVTWTEFYTLNAATVGLGVHTIRYDKPTAVSFTVLDSKITITRGSTATKSPRIWALGYVWNKREQLRYTFAFMVDALEYLRQNANGYDGLLTALKTLYDTVTPLTMTVCGEAEEWATTYNVRLRSIMPDPREATTLQMLGDLLVEVEVV